MNPEQREKASIGSPAFIAPECLSRGMYTIASDIYALGVLLFEVFTGQLPWKLTRYDDLLEKKSHFTPGRERFGHFSKNAYNLTVGMMHWDVEQRITLPDLNIVLANSVKYFKQKEKHRSNANQIITVKNTQNVNQGLYPPNSRPPFNPKLIKDAKSVNYTKQVPENEPRGHSRTNSIENAAQNNAYVHPHNNYNSPSQNDPNFTTENLRRHASINYPNKNTNFDEYQNRPRQKTMHMTSKSINPSRRDGRGAIERHLSVDINQKNNNYLNIQNVNLKRNQDKDTAGSNAVNGSTKKIWNSNYGSTRYVENNSDIGSNNNPNGSNNNPNGSNNNPNGSNNNPNGSNNNAHGSKNNAHGSNNNAHGSQRLVMHKARSANDKTYEIGPRVQQSRNFINIQDNVRNDMNNEQKIIKTASYTEGTNMNQNINSTPNNNENKLHNTRPPMIEVDHKRNSIELINARPPITTPHYTKSQIPSGSITQTNKFNMQNINFDMSSTGTRSPRVVSNFDERTKGNNGNEYLMSNFNKTVNYDYNDAKVSRPRISSEIHQTPNSKPFPNENNHHKVNNMKENRTTFHSNRPSNFVSEMKTPVSTNHNKNKLYNQVANFTKSNMTLNNINNFNNFSSPQRQNYQQNSSTKNLISNSYLN